MKKPGEKKPSADNLTAREEEEMEPQSERRAVLPTRESEMPRALSGWPEGSVYVPREPVYFTDFYPAEVPSSMRRYRSRGKYERKEARGAR